MKIDADSNCMVGTDITIHNIIWKGVAGTGRPQWKNPSGGLFRLLQSRDLNTIKNKFQFGSGKTELWHFSTLQSLLSRPSSSLWALASLSGVPST